MLDASLRRTIQRESARGATPSVVLPRPKLLWLGARGPRPIVGRIPYEGATDLGRKAGSNKGVGRYFNGSTSRVEWSGATAGVTNLVGTLVVLAWQNGGAGTERTALSMGTTFSSNPLFRLELNPSNQWRFQIRDFAGGVLNLAGTSTPAAGKACCVVGTCDGVSGAVRLFVDGVLEASGTAPSTGMTGGLNRTCVGNNARGTVEQTWFGGIAVAAVYEEAFTPAMARAISKNPALVLRDPDRQIFPPASSGTTLSLTDATHGHLADAIALTQQHLLVGSDATHAHGADSVALVQQHQLSAADAAHAHAADAVTLTQQHQLATADASHAHTADAITLVQQHAIAIADAMHAHYVDALTLAVQSTLAMSDATHAHGADGVTLSLAGSLAVADATHGHAVDPVALTQQHVLALADALHAHGSDVVTLGTGLALAVADAVHAQTADTLALSQVHLLVLADAAHAHLADTLALVMPGAITTLPDRTLVIAAEHRALVIVTETRALAIGAEARVLTIH